MFVWSLYKVFFFIDLTTRSFFQYNAHTIYFLISYIFKWTKFKMIIYRSLEFLILLLN